MGCAAASAGQATSRARSATLRAFIDASLVVSALLRRVGTHGLFVDRGTPTRARRPEERAVLDLGLPRHEVVVPGQRVDVDLPDAEVRLDGAEVGVDQRRRVAGVVVWRTMLLL